jgi:hypothetical protein
MARYRASRGTNPRDDVKEIARRLWDTTRGRFGGNYTYQDARNAALRAIRARETAAQMSADPGNRSAALARDYPLNYGIKANQPRYEYRTVVRGRGNGREFETAVTVRSNERLTAAEVAERAARGFIRIGSPDNRGNYGERVRELGLAPQIDTFIIAASQFMPSQ